MEHLQSLTKEELIKKLITAQNLNRFLYNRTSQPHKQISQYLDIIPPYKPPTPKRISQYLDTPAITTTKTLPTIKVQAKTLKGCTKSYNIEIIKNNSPLEQLNITRPTIDYKIALELKEQKGLKFVETIQVWLYKQVDTEYLTFKKVYFNSTSHAIINSTEITPALNRSAEHILASIGK